MEQDNSKNGAKVNCEQVGPERGRPENLVNGPENQSGTKGVNETVADDGEAGALLSRVQKLQERNTVLDEPDCGQCREKWWNTS